MGKSMGRANFNGLMVLGIKVNLIKIKFKE